MPFDIKQYLINRRNPNLLLTPLVDQFFLRADLSDFTSSEIKLLGKWVRDWLKPRDRSRFSPSNARRCLREQLLTISGEKPIVTNDPHLLSVFDDGNWRHIRWHSIFKRMERMKLLKVVRQEERVKYDPWLMGGTPDDVLDIPRKRNWDDMVRVVVDIKGAHNEKFRNIMRTGEADPGYIWQLHNYMQAEGLNLGILWYENKNDQRYGEILVRREMVIVKELRSRYGLLRKARNQNKLTEIECQLTKEDPMFRYCPQRRNCLRHLKNDANKT